MNYKELTDVEFKENVVEEIANICISIAWNNDEFVCTECLRTLEKLKMILGCLDDEVYKETVEEVNGILNKEN